MLSGHLNCGGSYWLEAGRALMREFSIVSNLIDLLFASPPASPQLLEGLEYALVMRFLLLSHPVFDACMSQHLYC